MRHYYNSNCRTLVAMAQSLIEKGFSATVCWSDDTGSGYLTTNACHHAISAARRAAW